MAFFLTVNPSDGEDLDDSEEENDETPAEIVHQIETSLADLKY